MYQAAADKAGPIRIDCRQVLINRVDGTEHAPASRARQTTYAQAKDSLTATALCQVEAKEHESRNGERNCGNLYQRLVHFERNEGKQAENRKEKLRRGLDENVDDDTGRCKRAGNPVQSQQPGADDIAADLHQQDVAAFAKDR